MGVDGFRCDVITLISKDQRFKNVGPTIALAGKKYFVNGPRLHEYLHELYIDVYQNYDCMTVGETVLSTLDDAKKLVEPERQELSMIFNFDHTDVDNFMGIKYFIRKFKLRRLKKVIEKWQHGLFGKGWNSLFIENHDQRRSIGRFGTDDTKYRIESACMLGATYFFLQGTPFIYQGQEIGMTNGDFKSIEDIKDVEAHNINTLANKVKILKPFVKKNMLQVSRDNARTPMQWDDSEYAGFSSVEPWLKVNANKCCVNVKESIEYNDSIYHFYQKLISFRKGNEVIKNGEYIDLLKSNSKIFAYKRKLDDKEIIIVSNFTKKEVKLPSIKGLDKFEITLSNYAKHTDVLKPYETRVYKNY